MKPSTLAIVAAGIALAAAALAGCTRPPPAAAPPIVAPQPPTALLDPSPPDFSAAHEPETQAVPLQGTTPKSRPEPPVPIAHEEPFEDPEPPQFRFVFFPFARADLDATDLAAVAYDARLLKARPHLRVVVEGHCDERGPEAFNQALGMRRAEAVTRALEADGIPKSRMVAVSLGEDSPLELGHSRYAWATNRSAVVRER